jgi:hypothetical protein
VEGDDSTNSDIFLEARNHELCLLVQVGDWVFREQGQGFTIFQKSFNSWAILFGLIVKEIFFLDTPNHDAMDKVTE